MDEDIDTVERVAFRIMRREITVACDLGVGVEVTEAFVVDDDAQGHRYHPTVVFDAELPFRKPRQHRSKLL